MKLTSLNIVPVLKAMSGLFSDTYARRSDFTEITGSGKIADIPWIQLFAYVVVNLKIFYSGKLS